MFKKYKQKIDHIDKETKDFEDVRDKLQCQYNLMKFQIACLMKQLHDRVHEGAGVDIDFKSRMMVENLNLSNSRRGGLNNSQDNSARVVSDQSIDLCIY